MASTLYTELPPTGVDDKSRRRNSRRDRGHEGLSSSLIGSVTSLFQKIIQSGRATSLDAGHRNDDSDSRLRTGSGTRSLLNRPVTSEHSSHTCPTTSGTRSSSSDIDRSRSIPRSRPRSRPRGDRSLSQTRSDRSLSSKRASCTAVSRSSSLMQRRQYHPSRRKRREERREERENRIAERESLTASNTAHPKDCASTSRDYDFPRRGPTRDRLPQRRRSRRDRDPPFETTGNSIDQNDHLPPPSTDQHIEIMIDTSTGNGAFHHPHVPELSFKIEDSKGTFIHPQNSKLTFHITFDIDRLRSEDQADPYEGSKYALECALGRLSKIREKNPKTDILGTLALWNKAQKGENKKRHDRKTSALSRGALLIETKKKNEVALVLCGRLSSLPDDMAAVAMFRSCKLSPQFCRDFEGFADDAFKFHAMLHGENGDKANIAAD